MLVSHRTNRLLLLLPLVEIPSPSLLLLMLILMLMLLLLLLLLLLSFSSSNFASRRPSICVWLAGCVRQPTRSWQTCVRLDLDLLAD
jgi:hypothetical protein